MHDKAELMAYTSQSDQMARAEVKLQPNTTIIGLDSNASLPNGWLKIDKVDNVIICNIKITNPCDLAPTWDSKDGAGNYDSEFDGMTIDGRLPLGRTDKNGVVKHIKSKIISQNNVFAIAGAAAGSCAAVVHNPNSENPEGAFADSGSLVNEAKTAGCTAPTSVSWSLPSGYTYPQLATSPVKAYVLANAGVGRL